MKSNLVSFAFIVTVLFCGSLVLAGIYLVNDNEHGSRIVSIDRGFSLSGLWNIVVESTGFVNDSARLARLEINVNNSGCIERIFIEFYGVKNDVWRYYQVSINNGKLRWFSSRVDGNKYSSYTMHPLRVLRVIDDMGINNIGCLAFDAPRKGFEISVEPVFAKEVAYQSSAVYKIVLWTNNTFIPVEKILIKNRNTIYLMEIRVIYGDRVCYETTGFTCSREPVCISCSAILIVPEKSFYDYVEPEY